MISSSDNPSTSGSRLWRALAISDSPAIGIWVQTCWAPTPRQSILARVLNEIAQRSAERVFRGVEMGHHRSVIVALGHEDARGAPFGCGQAMHQLGAVDVEQRIFELAPRDHGRHAVGSDMADRRIIFVLGGVGA